MEEEGAGDAAAVQIRAGDDGDLGLLGQGDATDPDDPAHGIERDEGLLRLMIDLEQLAAKMLVIAAYYSAEAHMHVDRRKARAETVIGADIAGAKRPDD